MFEPFLERQACLILDGGLATSLEVRGHDLNHRLWSARLLADDPDAIRDVHSEFLKAGADCVTSASYQATIEGFVEAGRTREEAVEFLKRSVALAVDSRNTFWAEETPGAGRLRPLVAASVGPYGAYLADGSEYTGDYGIDDGDLYAFHRERWAILASTGADLMACETVPSIAEGRVLLSLAEETPDVPVWLSFTCADAERLRDGTPFSEAVAACEGIANVSAVGINCTAPNHIADLVRVARQRTDKPIVVYPNSGERYDAESGTWSGGESCGHWYAAAPDWVRLGAKGVGGCCRTRARDIADLRALLLADGMG